MRRLIRLSEFRTPASHKIHGVGVDFGRFRMKRRIVVCALFMVLITLVVGCTRWRPKVKIGSR